jgi:hypothetical protein
MGGKSVPHSVGWLKSMRSLMMPTSHGELEDESRMFSDREDRAVYEA